jgi:hypothetical protein
MWSTRIDSEAVISVIEVYFHFVFHSIFVKLNYLGSSNQQSPYQLNQRNMAANSGMSLFLFRLHLRTHKLGVVSHQYSSASKERTQASSHTSMH